MSLEKGLCPVFKVGYLSFYCWVVRVPHIIWILVPCPVFLCLLRWGAGLQGHAKLIRDSKAPVPPTWPRRTHKHQPMDTAVPFSSWISMGWGSLRGASSFGTSWVDFLLGKILLLPPFRLLRDLLTGPVSFLHKGPSFSRKIWETEWWGTCCPFHLDSSSAWSIDIFCFLFSSNTWEAC